MMFAVPARLFCTLLAFLQIAIATIPATTVHANPTPYLIKDVADGHARDSDPTGFVSSGTLVFFKATTPVYGTELWKTDGTEAGTELVCDLTPGPDNSVISNLTVLNGRVYFSGWSAVSGIGWELYQTDGTPGGTIPVKDINPGSSNSYPDFLVAYNGKIYFRAATPSTGEELFMSDGTDAGTTVVKDIRPGSSGSNMNRMYAFGSYLYFSATDGTNGQELWRTDGTNSGTILVKDVDPGVNGSSPLLLCGSGSTLYFTAQNTTQGRELYKSDGTAGGTGIVTDIYSGAFSSTPENLTDVAGTLYFSALNSANGRELWKSNGTAGTTSLVADIRSGTPSSTPKRLANAGGKLVFWADDGTNGRELWKSDGGGTSLLMNINSGSYDSEPFFEPVTIGSQVYFQPDEYFTYGNELWRTDGTVSGTTVVYDRQPGNYSIYPTYITEAFAPGSMVFQGFDEVGREPWKSDGTSAGTTRIADINQGNYDSTFSSLVELGGKAIFYAFKTYTDETPLTVSDGTSTGTFAIGPDGAELTPFAGKVFFRGLVQNSGNELMSTDGTVNGTTMVRDIIPGVDSGSPESLVAAGSNLYFRAFHPDFGWELWKSDGTDEGTTIVVDYNPAGDSQMDQFTNVNGTLYFVYQDDEADRFLMKTDGTASGTVVITPSANPQSPNKLTSFNGTLFFRAYAGNHTLWTSDGTEPGTVEVSSDCTFPDGYYVDGSVMYFAAEDADGREVWKTDGTTTGTVRVADINPGSGSSNPANFISYNGYVYFSATDGTNGIELWRTDGTSTGTQLVLDCRPGSASSTPADFAVGGGHLLFSADDGVNGRELWASNGNPGGTGLFSDMYTGSVGGEPKYIRQIGSTIFLTGKVYSGTGFYVGNELYGLNPVSLPVSLSHFGIE
ncbi:MAG: hypothetical protein K1X53_11695 [Candidatus Sumerlaeaceae bacterium]|nr:hypothetical protein [Candidatus Sumerlaeaceae bacterium]